ncbi:hypothetical protein EBI_24870 [Enterocytozoon bieneusi H348]|nr:hypothetical protein EBI_24870 [Enterocytozoon bieneusi H348]|eukprot:XP_002649461.1 hypothetical protein EBI_24870 [Enterocytozoon bieneusi H348]
MENNFIQWPIPPINDEDPYQDNFIPKTIVINNIRYKRNDEVLIFDQDNQKIKLDEIQHLVNMSYQTFKTLLTTFSPKALDDIVEIHNKINDILNKGKIFEIDSAFETARKVKLNKVKSTIKEMYDLMN